MLRMVSSTTLDTTFQMNDKFHQINSILSPLPVQRLTNEKHFPESTTKPQLSNLPGNVCCPPSFASLSLYCLLLLFLLFTLLFFSCSLVFFLLLSLRCLNECYITHTDAHIHGRRREKKKNKPKLSCAGVIIKTQSNIHTAPFLCFGLFRALEKSRCNVVYRSGCYCCCW